VHQGQGLIEHNDIFGDVVNVAAKILPLVGSDRIVISRPFYDSLTVDPGLGLEKIEAALPPVLANLDLFNVVWDRQVPPASRERPLVMLRAWRTGSGRLFLEEAAALAQRTGATAGFWGDDILVVSCPTMEDGLDAACRVFAAMRDDHGAFVPLQCLVDHGKTHEDALPAFSQLPPGVVWVSAAARGQSSRLEAMTRAMPPLPWYCAHTPGLPSPIASALHRHLATGAHPPCFYCGDRRHSACDCPTKQADAPPQSLDALCRMNMDQIQAALWQDIIGTAGPDNAGSGPAGQAVRSIGFTCQIGMLRLVWDYAGRSWTQALAQSGPACSRGGAIWLAMDCLRTGRLEQAQSLLIGRGVTSFQSFAVQALIHCEQGRLDRAEAVLRQAMERAMSPVQKAYVLFLIHRVCRLMGQPSRAARALRRIKAIFPDCGQAIYEEIKLDLRAGRLARAATGLTGLIRRHPQYLAIAWIDPDLAGHETLIQQRLERILEGCRQQTEQQVKTAAEAFERLERFAGTDAPAVAACREELAGLAELVASGSYVGLRQALDQVALLREKIVRTVEARKKNLLAMAAVAEEVLAAAQIWRQRFANPVKTAAEGARLETAAHELEGLRAGLQEAAAGAVAACAERLPQISAEGRQIAINLEKRWHRHQLKTFALALARRSLLWQGLNVIIGMIALPLANRAIGLLAPQAGLSGEALAMGQAALLTIGAAAGLMLASGQAFQRVYVGGPGAGKQQKKT